MLILDLIENITQITINQTIMCQVQHIQQVTQLTDTSTQLQTLTIMDMQHTLHMDTQHTQTMVTEHIALTHTQQHTIHTQAIIQQDITAEVIQP